jgi:hypothetical protein
MAVALLIFYFNGFECGVAALGATFSEYQLFAGDEFAAFPTFDHLSISFGNGLRHDGQSPVRPMLYFVSSFWQCGHTRRIVAVHGKTAPSKTSTESGPKWLNTFIAHFKHSGCPDDVDRNDA